MARVLVARCSGSPTTPKTWLVHRPALRSLLASFNADIRIDSLDHLRFSQASLNIPCSNEMGCVVHTSLSIWIQNFSHVRCCRRKLSLAGSRLLADAESSTYDLSMGDATESS